MSNEPAQILVVDDDVDLARYLQLLLQRSGRARVRVAHDAASATTALKEHTVDLVITDIEMPGETGLEMLPRVRELVPGVPVIVVTAHANVDYAVDALRKEADEFFVKPVDSQHLVTRAFELIAEAQAKHSGKHEVVLAVGAHPDDVELGIGATLARHRAAGDAITILTMSADGIGGELEVRRGESEAAAALLDARLVTHDFEATGLDAAPGLTAAIEQLVAEISPTIVYSHSEHDRYEDHRAVARAVEIATRRIPVVAAFQSPSATLDYRPTRFIPVDGYMDAKLELLDSFTSQVNSELMEPELVTATARYWARFGQGTYCEPVEMVRDSAPPHRH